MDNPVVLVLLIALACASVIIGVVIAANIYRRREEAASRRRDVARLDESRRAMSYAQERRQAAVHQPAPAQHVVRTRFDARPVQQPDVHGTSGTDLFNVLMMQQALINIGDDHRDEHHEDRSEKHYESQEQAQEYAPEPAYEASVVESTPKPVYASEQVSYTAPEPAYTAPEPAPSYDSPSYSDSGSFGGGDSGGF